MSRYIGVDTYLILVKRGDIVVQSAFASPKFYLANQQARSSKRGCQILYCICLPYWQLPKAPL